MSLVTAGALPGFDTNVFIDGVSYKNDVLLGGVVGQDSSRGNPFPQNAVQDKSLVANGFTFVFGNRRPDGECCFAIPGFSNPCSPATTRRPGTTPCS